MELSDFTFVELKQKHIENWSKDIPDSKDTKIPVYNGAVVRSAVKAGWFDGLKMKVEDVDDLSPALVKDLALKIMQEYARVMEVSPE